MPTIFNPSHLAVTRQSGATHTTLTDRAMLGADALHIERIALDPGAHTPPAQAPDAEHFLYVIRGAGSAHVGSKSFPLEPESILWLEAGDTCSLEAGADGLEVLSCRAPVAPSTPPDRGGE